MNVSLRRFLFSSLSVWVLITIIGLYFLFHFKHFINFGVDLVGGTYITLEVHPEKAIEVEIANRLQLMVEKLRKANFELPTSKVEHLTGALTFVDSDAAKKAEAVLAENMLRYRAQRDDARITLQLSTEEAETIRRASVEGNIHVLEKRLNPTGASEVTIVQQGKSHIIVELPNVHDVRQAKAMIGKTALLEIKLVEDSGASEEDLLARYGGTLPEDLMIASGSARSGQDRFYVVPKYTDLTGRLLKDASMDIGGQLGAEPLVRFEFKPEGGDKFYELTSANQGRQIAILIDNIVITAPVVQAKIRSEGQITGSFSVEEAQDLATLLKSGAFVAPVTFEEERHIGPSLGYQSIRMGLVACIVGLALLLLFSLIFYKLSGLLAFIVLLYNLLLILFAMSWLGATLTLPGIAGMLLTVGMAIDASILFYERIRDELAQGVPFKKAIDTGFSGAMSVILDANITSLLVAIVLYKFGAGPIRGFAIAMIIGIISTLSTGVLLLRSIFKFLLDGLGIKKISI